LDAKFVIWFVPVDYDLLWTKLGKMGHDESLIDLIRNWRDCGLFNERREARPSLNVRDACLKLPIREEE